MSQNKNKLMPVLFFFSGIPALIYQLIWQRSLFSIYGTNVQCTTMIVAIFMFGLGLGALFGGYLSKTFRFQLLLLFGILELLIGSFGFFSLPILHYIGNVSLQLPLTYTSLVVFSLLLIPTLLMGASLPILVAYLAQILPNIRKAVGILYSANTFGADFACFCLATFVIKFFGQIKTIYIAVTLNFIIGTIAIIVNFFPFFTHKLADPQLNNTFNLAQEKASNQRDQFKLYLVLLLSVLTGYIALSYEIIWFHVFSFITGSRGRDFALFLGYYLAGIGFGAYILAKLSSTKLREHSTKSFQLLFATLITSALVTYLVIPSIVCVIQHTNNINYFLAIIGLATVMFGITFPLLSNYYVNLSPETGSRMGKFYFANIVGSTASVLITGFFFMNILSLGIIAKLLFIISIGTALLGLFIFHLPKLKIVLVAALTVLLAVFIFLITNNTWQYTFDKMLYRTAFVPTSSRLRFLVENNVSVIAVTKEDAVFGGGAFDGYFNIDPMHNVNGIWRVYTIPLFCKNPENVLMIDLSSGSFAQVIAHNPEVKHLTIVEINPGYLSLIKKYPENVSLLKNPKVSIIIDDGRRWLLRNPEQQFNLIVMNTPYHFRAYTSLLVSTNFLEIIKKHLTKNGIFYFNTTFSFDVAKTALAVFSHVMSLANFIIASNEPIFLDRTYFKELLSNYTINTKKIFTLHNPEVRATFEKIITIPDYGMYSREKLEKLTIHSHIITDDNMWNEW